MTAWHWFMLAILLLVLELLKTQGYLLWLSVDAAIVAIINWLAPNLTWPYALVIFILLGILSCAWWYRALKKKPVQINKLRAKQYFGRVYTLEKPVKKGKGQLEIDGLIWFVQSEQDLAKGDKIRIKSANGVVLIIEAYQADTKD